MWSTRPAVILEGGSVYWIVKVLMLVRQPIIDIAQETDADGRGFARLHLGPVLVRVAPRNHRPFQGWRYLEAADAPADLAAAGAGGDDLPPVLQAELRAWGIP